MKIGIDIRTLMDREYSGVAEYTFNLVSEIIRQDQDSSGHSRNEYKLFYNIAADISDRLPQFIAPNVTTVHTRYPNKIFNYGLEKILKWPKIDQLLGVDLFFMPHINFIALSRACQKIITIHDLSWFYNKRFYSRRQNLWHSLINIRKLLDNFDIIVAVSDNTKRDIVDLYQVDEEKVKVIYSGIAGAYQVITDQSLLAAVKAKYNLPDHFILYLGAIEPRKNIITIVSAYNSLINEWPDAANYHLVLAGGRGRKSKKVIQAIESSPRRAIIKLLGYVDRRDRAALYNLASLFIYPSFYEGFGFPPLEAMACGTPVIASRVTSLPEILDNAALLVDPYNARDLVSAMAQVLSDKGLCEKLRQQGREQAAKFNWVVAAQNYLALFNSFKR